MQQSLLSQYLLESPTPRLYMANTGNLGDALIRQGTLRFFRNIGLDYTETRQPPTTKIGTFIYGGGGAWCKNWNHGYLVEKALRKAGYIIVLPSTYAIHSPLYDVKNIRFFRRDKYESRTYCPTAIFHRDMAFYLEHTLTPKLGVGIGHFMRTDKERSGHIPIPLSNRDISILGATFDDTAPFIDAINAVRRVHTDRLHVAIVACMLKKKVFLYAGNYFKNRAVYLSSMKDRFDVTFRKHDRG